MRTQADITHAILLLQPPQCRDYICGTPCLASTILFSQMINDLVGFFLWDSTTKDEYDISDNSLIANVA